ncbi:TlyA family RNA methyltransferase [Spiroplasma tabanidicola]|uniref:rRNA methyltransferase n=1 Tax=Spiroplasma tabanidicola TaxID=324079 RepID=A0A6I6C912_9MOLU|nr:TlyA family RNA methyltransferase [Spiroplasma tabanidicola]QGS51949.1 rRNA methyltransferase [Spiroplasma tabanidicola]
MKERLDQILINKKLFENRNKARSFIVDGKIIVNNEKIIKPGTMFDPEKIILQIINNEKTYVSRAGKKLEKAIINWNIVLKDKVCLDIGSSTGGFTDCCLSFGASYVYAIDVGTNQLDWKLRSDSRVKSIEKTNFRIVNSNYFAKKIDFFCCDVSFISVEKILIPLKDIVEEGVEGIILIKPQFESDKDDIKNGKINSKGAHKKSVLRVIGYCHKNNFMIKGINFSPVLGNKKKNIEYLCYIKKSNEKNFIFNEEYVNNIIEESWDYFANKKNKD